MSGLNLHDNCMGWEMLPLSFFPLFHFSTLYLGMAFSCCFGNREREGITPHFSALTFYYISPPFLDPVHGNMYKKLRAVYAHVKNVY